MFGLPNELSDRLSDELIEIFDHYFSERFTDYGVFNMTDNPYTMFSINFRAYNYFSMVLNYDRGRFGCSIETGKLALPIENSQKWYDKADMDIFCKELQEQLELRIPDKFLDHNGWK